MTSAVAGGRARVLADLVAADAPIVMGVLNPTPDSFSDGGRFLDRAVALDHAERMLRDGADIIDVGGESSRPGADPVSIDDELARVVPIVEALAGRCPISIDTAKAEVAAAAIAAGAHVVNDITASLDGVAAEHGAGWIAMHMQGEPRTMQDAPRYDDVVAEVHEALAAHARRGAAAGVPALWLDPGIGFGKTTNHNLQLLHALTAMSSLGDGTAVGVSRKRFIGELHAASDGAEMVDADDRLEGSVMGAVWAVRAGARIVRVHDVRATREALRLLRP